MDQFENMFGHKPREYTSPLEKGDHPEIDNIRGTGHRRHQEIPNNDRLPSNGLYLLDGLTYKQQQ